MTLNELYVKCILNRLNIGYTIVINDNLIHKDILHNMYTNYDKQSNILTIKGVHWLYDTPIEYNIDINTVNKNAMIVKYINYMYNKGKIVVLMNNDKSMVLCNDTIDNLQIYYNNSKMYIKGLKWLNDNETIDIIGFDELRIETLIND